MTGLQERSATNVTDAPAASAPLPVSPSDETLVNESLHGDQAAFSRLAGRHLRATFTAAFSLLRNREEAEDAVQEAMVKAFHHLPSLRDPAKVGAWLRQIARQEALGRLRRLSRLRHFLERFREEPELRSPAQPTPARRRVYHAQLFERCIAVLPSKAKNVVLLHYIEGLSCEEIAERTGTAAGTIKSHLFKARNKMQQRLKKLGIEETDI